jgi:hypothetical protein
MGIVTDRRRIEAEDAPEAKARAAALIAKTREVELALAHVLAEIDDKRAYTFDGCASIGEWARSKGYDPVRAAELATLGRAMRTTPALEPKVRSGEVTTPAATTVAKILVQPALVKPDEDLLAKAAAEPLRDLQREVKKRVEGARQGAEVTPLTVLVSEATRAEFRLARDIASQQAKKELSESQAFARITRHFVDSFDDTRKVPRARRMKPTEEEPFRRGVAAQTKRTLVVRSGRRCEVPGCARVATERAHVRPHEHGSGREARDLWNACHPHHVLYDAGVLRIVGWTSEGKPRFALRDGRPKRARPGTPREAEGGG